MSMLTGTADVLIAANWLLTQASLATALQVASGIGALLAGAFVVAGILYSAGERCRTILN